MPTVEVAGKKITFKNMGDFKEKVQEELQIVAKALEGAEDTYKSLKKRQKALLKTLRDGEETATDDGRILSTTGA